MSNVLYLPSKVNLGFNVGPHLTLRSLPPPQEIHKRQRNREMILKKTFIIILRI